MKLSIKAIASAAAACLIVVGAATGISNAQQEQQAAWPVAANQKLVTTRTGLQYVDLQPGPGPSPSPGTYVSVHYTGWFLNKQKFDSSVDRGTPFEFQLGAGQVIKGWDEGVASMKVGGKRRLVVPPNLAYGQQGMPGAIPPNSTLVFDVQLIKFSATPTQQQ
jgi:peptidylprolyl isomerase